MTKILAAAVLLTACSKNDPAPIRDNGASAPGAAAATVASAGASIPTPEDYEATAAKTITAENVDAQLNALEKEIAATPK